MFVFGLLLLLVLYKAQVNTRVPRTVFQTHKSWEYIESNKTLKRRDRLVEKARF